MDKKGGIKIILSILVIILILIGIASIFYFMSKPKINCPKSSEDDYVLRFPIPKTATIAGGKQTGAENYKFVTGEKVLVCCAEVETSDGRRFKDCINSNYGEEKKDYKVVWEEINGELVKFAESITEGELECIYDFDESGEQSGRYCYDPNEELEETEREEPTSLSDCQSITDQYQKDSCYREIANLKEDKTICADIQTDFVQSLCYSDVACETGDVSICEMFEKELSPTHADTVLCYKCVAIKNNDISLCEKIKDNYFKSNCYMDIAYSKNDPSYCNKIDQELIDLNKQYYLELCQ